MMHGREKSDSAIVARKPANKAVPTAAEPVERRAGTEGNANQQSMGRAQNRGNHVTSAGAHTGSRKLVARFAVTHPRWEKLWGGRRRSWHLHRRYESMEVTPWSNSMISAEA